MNHMIIRNATLEEVGALSVVASKTYAEAFGDGLTPEQLESVLKSSRSEEYFKSVIGKDLVLVALVDSRVVAYIQVSDVRYEVEGVEVAEGDQAVHSIYVDSGYQGSGIGRALMDAAFSHPRVMGAEKVFVDIFEENMRAINL